MCRYYKEQVFGVAGKSRTLPNHLPHYAKFMFLVFDKHTNLNWKFSFLLVTALDLPLPPHKSQWESFPVSAFPGQNNKVRAPLRVHLMKVKLCRFDVAVLRASSEICMCLWRRGRPATLWGRSRVHNCQSGMFTALTHKVYIMHISSLFFLSSRRCQRRCSRPFYYYDVSAARAARKKFNTP